MNGFKLPHLILRLGLAAVFLWFGIDKFFHPTYWINAWVPGGVLSFFDKFGVNDLQFIYLNGIFEVLVGLSLVTGIFIRFFSFLAILFLISIFAFIGFNEVVIRDVGLIGGFAALVVWPKRRI